MTEPVFEICDRVVEVQVLLRDHLESGEHTAAEVVEKAHEILSANELLRATWDVEYFRFNSPLG